MESHETPGLSGARNAGLQAASQPITVFLDDDAEARPGWLAALSSRTVRRMWWPPGAASTPCGRDSARWLPPAFNWVVGCSYRGLPENTGVVRNPIGANMSMRTRLALAAGGFDVAWAG